MSELTQETVELALAKLMCEQEHLFFTRYFFNSRHGLKFKVNWHHVYIADTLERVLKGEVKNVCISVPPGSSKTEVAVINFIARGLAINPRSRFLHLSGSDSLASLNSATAREIIRSDEYQRLWPIRISDDANAKKRWNVLVNDQPAGGVYATSLGGQITGFRAGHMAPGFQGAILIDDPIKPEDAFSKPKLDAANRKLLTTVNSRKANPDTPIIVIMQRIAESDPVGFIEKGNMDGDWTFIKIPAVLTKEFVKSLPQKYQDLIDAEGQNLTDRFSYWPYKEPLEQLLRMEKGEGQDQSGGRISRHVFNSQYQQEPIALGGNMLKGEYFTRYTVLPKIKYRKMFADTAQKTKERNDYSVFAEFGLGEDMRLYLIDLIRGKWEAPELQKRATAFWAEAKARDAEQFGQIRKLQVEDKSSGTGLIQTLKLPPYNIPIEGIERNKDKLTRLMDVLPYIDIRSVCVPESEWFTNDFIAECESFSADGSHDNDDQVDCLIDAIDDMLSNNNKLKRWEALGKPEATDQGKPVSSKKEFIDRILRSQKSKGRL